jgi:predicted DCC family thiol-disulfide oxidoreductase YuxK
MPLVTKPDPNRLPTVNENPTADVVIYDGHCRFCANQVRRLAKWDGRRRLAFLSLHDERVAQRYPDLTYAQMMEQMYVVTSDGRRYGGAAAFRYLTRRLPRLWVLVPAMHLPFSLTLWQWAYRQVARRRYLMGKTEDCEGDVCKVNVR